MNIKPYRILVVAPSWVGDMVMSQTLLKLLKKRHSSDCQIDILVNSWACDIAKRMPEVANVYLNPFRHGELGLIKRFKLGWQLRKNKYDQAFILPNSLKSALIPFFAGIPKRTGFVGEMRYGLINDIFRLDKHKLPRMIDRFCALANEGKSVDLIQNPKFTVDTEKQAQLINRLGLNLTRPVICFCPAAEYGPAKRWPPEYFTRLSVDLIKEGYQVWLLGSAKDEAIAREIVMGSGFDSHLYNLCGKTTLVEVVDLLAIAQIVISNDSGLMHVACALDVPVIAVYGSSSPQFTPPLSARAIIEKINIECSPCFQRTCKYGHYNCLKQITPNMLLERIHSLNINN